LITPIEERTDEAFEELLLALNTGSDAGAKPVHGVRMSSGGRCTGWRWVPMGPDELARWLSDPAFEVSGSVADFPPDVVGRLEGYEGTPEEIEATLGQHLCVPQPELM
jgi:hypothetical protein